MKVLSEYKARPHWSASSLNELLNICSLKWAYSHGIYEAEQKFTPVALAFGSCFHQVLEYFHNLKLHGVKVEAGEIPDLAHVLWTEAMEKEKAVRLEEGMTSDGYADQLVGLLNTFIEHDDPEEKVLSVHEAFCVPLLDSEGQALEKPLIGEMDCIVRKGDQTTIVDWKTSARRWPKWQADKSLQATSYMFAHSLLHPEVKAGFRFDVVVKNKNPIVERHATERTQEDFVRLGELVGKADQIVEHELFFPNESSFACSGCPYQAACKNWHREHSRVISLAA